MEDQIGKLQRRADGGVWRDADLGESRFLHVSSLSVGTSRICLHHLHQQANMSIPVFTPTKATLSIHLSFILAVIISIVQSVLELFARS